MAEKDFSATNLVVFSQQVEEGQRDHFQSLCDQVVKYADDNKKTKLKKQDILSILFKKVLPGLKPEDFFA